MRSLAVPVAFLLAPVVVGVVRLAAIAPRSAAAPLTTDDVPDRPAPPARAHDRLAVLLVGNGGTEITDALAPVEILGASGLFDVVTVAPERRASPMTNGLLRDAGVDVLPHYDLDGYTRDVGRAPDLILVPWLPAYQSVDAALLPWLRAYAGPDTIVLSVCAGGAIVAATGLLDGLRATATYEVVPDLRAKHPAVRWDRDVRFVVDGTFVSSSTLATGIDAALAAVEIAGGRGAAERAARKSGYRGLRVLDDPRLVREKRLSGLLRGAWTFDPSEIGVQLDDGVREAAVAAQLDTWPQSLADVATTIASERVVRTRHGLDLVARRTDADGLDRVESAEVPDGVFPHDAVLRRIAALEGTAPARAAAGNLYFTAPDLDGPLHRGLAWKPVAIGLLAAAAVVAQNSRRRA